MKKVTMEIRNGKCVIKTEGFKCSSCLSSTVALKQLIGKEEGEVVHTDEFYAEEIDDSTWQKT